MAAGELVALRKMAEELNEKDEELAAFFSLSPVWLLVCTPRDILRASQSMLDDLGYKASELENQPWANFIVPADINESMEARDTLLEGRNLTSFRNTWVKKDGGLIPVSWHVTAYQPGQTLAYAVGIPEKV